MYKLPTIIIQFDNEIESKALPYFRGAVIASLEKKDILFHNHNEKDEIDELFSQYSENDSTFIDVDDENITNPESEGINEVDKQE